MIDAKDKHLWPASALHDDDFLSQYPELKKSGVAILPSTTATADLLASANHHVSIGKAASGSLPAAPTPSTAGTPFPSAAALAGRHVKVELPKPSKFSRIAVDSDIRAWLLRMHEYLTISGVEPKAWVVFASNFLAQAPLQLWEARKTQLIEQPDVLYLWDNFREWCISSFSVHNHEKHALQQLESYAKLVLLLNTRLLMMCLLHKLFCLCNCASLGGSGVSRMRSGPRAQLIFSLTKSTLTLRKHSLLLVPVTLISMLLMLLQLKLMLI